MWGGNKTIPMFYKLKRDSEIQKSIYTKNDTASYNTKTDYDSEEVKSAHDF